jgi:pimeloyl-ACP methyl ester carboxylesterase
VLRPPQAGDRVLVMLHGILGQGNNLRGLARQFIERHAGWTAVLLDLRAHGSSLAPPGDADTVAHAAADVRETLAHAGLAAHAVVGHSFGGKVALMLAEVGVAAPHIMTLDSGPGARPDARGSEATADVLRLLRELTRGGSWPTRDAFVDVVVRHGHAQMVAQWLAMNLERVDDRFRFKLPMERIDALIDDYLQVDLWRVVERATSLARVHLVIATRSTVYDHDERVRAQGLETSSGGAVAVDLVDAGHWLHVENQAAVLEVMGRRLG